jgi:hypothetical protein
MPIAGLFANATYSSEGRLHHVEHDTAPDQLYFFAFAGRPIAQLEVDGDNETFAWLTTDHLGTPIAKTNATGTRTWQGGFEPYGQDFADAAAANVLLRLPGQWKDPAWDQASLGAEVYDNVHRWYEAGVGRYGRVDPVNLGRLESASRDPQLPIDALTAYHLAMLRAGNPKFEHAYGYAQQSPLVLNPAPKISLRGA